MRYCQSSSGELIRDFVAPLMRALGKQMAEARKAEVPAGDKPQPPKKDRVKPRT